MHPLLKKILDPPLNIQLLPKAADLRKKAFDELRLNMLIDLL